MQTINVTYPAGCYPLYLGEHFFAQLDCLKPHIVAKQVMVVTNETIAPLYLSSLCQTLSDYQVSTCILPDGERHKTLANMSQIIDRLIVDGHHRDTTLIALGGGVVGDMVGFAAACFHRGVHFIQIPTTLLAQVDASIGGKTAVNHPQGKNLIGAFHQPQAVVIDIKMLTTLPDREYYSGIAEIIKAALIRDADFFTYLEQHIDALLARDSQVLLTTIARACCIKRDIVAEDEKERHVRALLNLGHTFGHAIEQNQNYLQLLHGEAVAVGMMLAALLSQQLGWISADDVARIERLIERAQLPTALPSDCDASALMAAMYSDKKILAGRLRLVLLQDIGQAVITDKVAENQIRQLLQRGTKGVKSHQPST